MCIVSINKTYLIDQIDIDLPNYDYKRSDSINLSHIHINAPKDSGGIGLHRKNAHTCQTHLGPHMLSIC